jgi:hypothetical protein
LCPTFTRASQNKAVAAALLDTLPMPSTNGVDGVYHQLKDILSIATEQQAESSLQQWVEASISSPSHSKASQHETALELPMVQTVSSSAWAPNRLWQGPRADALSLWHVVRIIGGRRGAFRAPRA